MKVQGGYVAVVEDTDHPGSFTLLIRENKDNPPYGSVSKTSPSSESKYLYGPNASEFALPDGYADGTKFARALNIESTLKIDLLNADPSGGDKIKVDDPDSLLKVDLVANGSTRNLYSAPAKNTPEGSTPSLATNVYCSLCKEVDDEDVRAGYTAGTLRLEGVKVELKMNDSTILPQGGAAKIVVSIGSVSKETPEFFFYEPKAPTMTGTISGAASPYNRKISGYDYYGAGAVVTLSGSGKAVDTCHYARNLVEKVNIDATQIGAGTVKLNAPANAKVGQEITLAGRTLTVGQHVGYTQSVKITAKCSENTSSSI